MQVNNSGITVRRRLYSILPVNQFALLNDDFCIFCKSKSSIINALMLTIHFEGHSNVWPHTSDPFLYDTIVGNILIFSRYSIIPLATTSICEKFLDDLISAERMIYRVLFQRHTIQNIYNVLNTHYVHRIANRIHFYIVGLGNLLDGNNSLNNRNHFTLLGLRRNTITADSVCVFNSPKTERPALAVINYPAETSLSINHPSQACQATIVTPGPVESQAICPQSVHPQSHSMHQSS
jgi:hypothetical protein